MLHVGCDLALAFYSVLVSHTHTHTLSLSLSLYIYIYYLKVMLVTTSHTLGKLAVMVMVLSNLSLIAEPFLSRLVSTTFSARQSRCCKRTDSTVCMGPGMGRKGNRGPHKRRLQLGVEERKLPQRPSLQPDLLKDLVVPVKDDPLMNEVLTIVKAADKRKAEDIKALRVSRLTTSTEFMVIMQANNRIQNQAIAAAIIDDMKEAHARFVCFPYNFVYE